MTLGRNRVNRMTCYPLRVVPLLFLVLHMSACFLPRSDNTPSPDQLIGAEQLEAERPLSVLVTKVDQTQVAVDTPFVEGDELRGTIIVLRDGRQVQTGIAIPMAEITAIQVTKSRESGFLSSALGSKFFRQYVLGPLVSIGIYTVFVR